MSKFKFTPAVLALGVLLQIISACSTRTIEYSLKKITPAEESSLKHLTLNLQVFSDQRKTLEKNNVLFKHPLKQTPAEQAWYWNSELRYKTPVCEGLTNMLAMHLQTKNSFKAITINAPEQADYSVEGELNFFYAAQQPAKAGAVLVVASYIPIFTIPAIVLLSLEKSHTVVVIEIKNLKIFNRHHDLVYQTELKERYERRCHSRGGAKAVYRNANHMLSEYNEFLVRIFENEISKADFAAQKNN